MENSIKHYQNISIQSRDLKNIKIQQPRVELQEIMKNCERERERDENK